MKLMKKIHNDKGESLIEVLASIVIGSLSVALMFGCIMVSADMDENAKDMDLKHYKDLTAADVQESDPSATPIKVRIERESPAAEGEDDPYIELDIEIYGDEGMSSYRRAK